MTAESRPEHPIIDRAKELWSRMSAIKHKHMLRRGQESRADLLEEIKGPYDEVVAHTAEEVLAAKTQEGKKAAFASARQKIPYGVPVTPVDLIEDIALAMERQLREKLSPVRRLRHIRSRRQAR